MSKLVLGAPITYVHAKPEHKLPPLVLPSAPPSRGKLGLKHLKDILEKILRVAHFVKTFLLHGFGAFLARFWSFPRPPDSLERAQAYGQRTKH